MRPDNNPFEYEAANNLTDEMIVDYYIDDFNYSRFIQSKRNIFLVGDRGSGKTMALLFNQWRIQNRLALRDGDCSPMSMIGVYVPCNTPLTHKVEYQLLANEFLGSVISEHFLVLSMVHYLSATLADIRGLLDGANENDLRNQIGFLFEHSFPESTDPFDMLMQYVGRELRRTQRAMNTGRDTVYEDAFSFASTFVPLVGLCVRHIPRLTNSHFLLLLDDAHSLNQHQRRLLNSWIAYRDHSRFSFKVAVAKVGPQEKLTASGGSILEGHDYTSIELAAPLHNSGSSYYKLAKMIVERRLQNVSISQSAEEFFPVSQSMMKDLETSERAVREEATSRYGNGDDTRRAVRDHVYKYKRVHYFRSRSAKANLPPYSGFDTLVYLSTGVIRNLLEACYWMFERVASESGPSGSEAVRVSPAIQTDIILDRSRKKWDWLSTRMSSDIEGCSTEDGERALSLLDALATHFRERLLRHQSEPSALSFTISGRSQLQPDELEHLLGILREAQLLYARSGVAKDDGKIETYYVPNKILWPVRGLDPRGQHARVSIPATVLWRAAMSGKIEYTTDEGQGELWDEA